MKQLAKVKDRPNSCFDLPNQWVYYAITNSTDRLYELRQAASETLERISPRCMEEFNNLRSHQQMRFLMDFDTSLSNVNASDPAELLENKLIPISLVKKWLKRGIKICQIIRKRVAMVTPTRTMTESTAPPAVIKLEIKLLSTAPLLFIETKRAPEPRIMLESTPDLNPAAACEKPIKRIKSHTELSFAVTNSACPGERWR